MLNKNKKLLDKKLKSLYSIFLNTSEVIYKNSENNEVSEYEHAVLTLIASVISANEKIDESELNLASAFFRNNAPVDRANKLLSQLEIMLKNKDTLSIESAAKVFKEKLSKTDTLKIFNALIQYTVDNKTDSNKEIILTKIGIELGYTQENISKYIENKKSMSEKAQKYGKIGGIAFVIIFLAGIILLAGFLRPIFLGLAFAYLMDPLLTFFEKKTRFSRNSICIASIIIFLLIVTLGTIKLFSSINIEDIKDFAVNTPTKLWDGLEKFKYVLKEKNVPPQIIEPLDQLLYGSVILTQEDIPESEQDHLIDDILHKSIDTDINLLVLFPEYNEKFKFNNYKRESFLHLMNHILTTPEMRIKWFENCKFYKSNITNVADFLQLDEIKQKIVVRNLFTTAYELNKFSSTNEHITKHIKDLLVTDVAKYSNFLGGLLSRLKILGRILIDFALAIGFYYFFARKFYQIGKGILETVPVAYRYNTDQIFRKINWILEGYMRGQFLLILLEASFYTTIFYFLGIKYFYIFGLISGIAVLVPYIGIATAYTLTLSAAIAGGMNVTTAIVIITLVYGTVNLTENFFLAPKLVGDRVGLSDLETLIALVTGGTLGGVIGVVLAIPVAAILKVFVIMLYEWYKESPFYLQSFPVDEQLEDADQKAK